MQSIINSLLDPVVNFGKVTVSTGYSNFDTVIVLAAGDGSKLPHPNTDGNFNLVWFNNSTYSDPTDDPNVEIVRCTVRTDDVLTVTRHQEGTIASNKNASGKTYKMILSPTKKTIDDIKSEYQSGISAHSALYTGIHGVTGNVVGTSDTQVLTNKTLTTPTIDDFTNANHTHAAMGIAGGIIDHTNLTNIGTNTHTAIDTAISNSTSHIAAAAPHSGHDTPAQRDAAIGTAIGTHAGLTTGVHGVTGSVLGTEDIGVANGAAGLDAGGKIPTTQLPGLALTDVYTIASQVAQLALNAITQEGDVAIRTDENKSYVRNSGVSGDMTDWSLLLTPTDVVTSVFGRTGVVAATSGDYTWAQINKTTSSIGDITTKSHTLLTDIGTNSHTAIDTHIGNTGTSVHGLGSMSTQSSTAVSITGGTVTGTTVKTAVGLQLPVGTNKWVT